MALAFGAALAARAQAAPAEDAATTGERAVGERLVGRTVKHASDPVEPTEVLAAVRELVR